MGDDALRWRVETACLNAWPAPHQLLMDGWLVRAAGGPSRRVNSASPLHGAATHDDALIRDVESFYRQRGAPAIFRIPDMAPDIDGRLARRGYRIDAPTRTLFADLTTLVGREAPGVSVEGRPGRRWLAARDRLSESTAQAAAAARAVIGAILLPGGYAAVTQGERIVALAYGVVQGDLLVIESVLTDPARRRCGHARACLAGLFAWAGGQGVRAVALQVMAHNTPALALYRDLGVSRDLYGYHYRIAERAGRA
jgi:ribosomal protein S18 acetylase RimI-like enzyme